MATRDGEKPAGWIVSVKTKRLGDEAATIRTYYAAALFMPAEAEEAVRKRDGATPDELVEAVEPISQATLDGLGVAKGAVAPYP